MKKSVFAFFAFISVLLMGFSLKERAYTVYNTESNIIYDICFTNKGEALAIADHLSVKVYATRTKVLLNEFKEGHTKQILTIDLSKDSTLLVSGAKDSTIVIWDLMNQKKLETLMYQKGFVTTVQLSPDKKYLLSGGTDHKVYVYSLDQRKVMHVLTEHTDDVTAVSFSPDGKLVATAGADKMIHVYQTDSFKLTASLTGHKSWVRDIAFNSESTRLISCGDDAKIITWGITADKTLQKQNASKNGFGWLLSINYNEDNRTYVSGGTDGKVRIVTQFGEYKATIGSPINSVIFKPNEGAGLVVALATRGKGVVLVESYE